MTSTLEIWKDAQPTLSDGVITIRPWNSSDIEWVYGTCQDEAIQRWTRVPSPYSRDDAEHFVITHAGNSWDAGVGAHFAVVASEDEGLVGSVALSDVRTFDRVSEGGFWTVPESRGQGLTTRALSLLTHWAIETAGFVRLELNIEVENAASRVVGELSGYQLDGVFQKKIWKHGAHRDVALYSYVR